MYNGTIQDEIVHSGILGMKWGQRRARGPDGRVGSTTKVSSSKKTKSKSDVSEDHREARKLKKKGVKALSTNELKNLNNRLQLEKQYKDLTPNKYKQGMNLVKGVTAAGTTLAALYGLSKTPLGQQVTKWVSTAIDHAHETENLKWVL